MSETAELSYRVSRDVNEWRFDGLLAMPLVLLARFGPWWLLLAAPPVVVLIVRRHSWRLRVRPDGFESRRTFRTRRVAMEDVRSLEPWVTLQSGECVPLNRPTLNEAKRSDLEMFVHRHAPHVEVRPLRVTRSEALLPDPATSLAAVRMATVRRWRIRIRPVAGGFRAEATTLYGPPGSRTGSVRPTVERATEDGIAMIEEFEREQ